MKNHLIALVAGILIFGVMGLYSNNAFAGMADVSNQNIPQILGFELPPRDDCECTDLGAFPKEKENTVKNTVKRVPTAPDGTITLERIGPGNDKFLLTDTKNWETEMFCKGETGECTGEVTVTPKLIKVHYNKPVEIDEDLTKLTHTAGANKIDDNPDRQKVTCKGKCPQPKDENNKEISFKGEFSTKYEVFGGVKNVGQLVKPIVFEIQYSTKETCNGFTFTWIMKQFMVFTFDAKNQEYVLDEKLWLLKSNFDGDKKSNASDKDDFDPFKT